MADITAKLPEGFLYVYQFAANKSQYKCVAAVLAMIGEFAYPGRYQSPTNLMSQIYEHYAGPDVASNQQGMTKEQCFDWLHSQGIGYIDLSALIGDTAALHDEIEAQNRQDVIQLITVADESKLCYAKNGQKLHNWVDVGLHHCILRTGFSTDQGYGLYEEPAASPAFPHPVPILWENIVEAGILTAVAIMPHGVGVPPEDFRYTHGTWPVPPKPAPVLDITKILGNLNQVATVGQQLTTLATELAKDIAVLKQEV